MLKETADEIYQDGNLLFDVVVLSRLLCVSMSDLVQGCRQEALAVSRSGHLVKTSIIRGLSVTEPSDIA